MRKKTAATVDGPGVTPGRVVVVSHRAWIAEELAASGLCPVHPDMGFDAPDLTPGEHAGTAWWMVTEHAARLLRVGVPLRLQATGPDWLPTIPEDLLLREIWSGTLDRIGEAPTVGWCKPAEAKIGEEPVQWESSASFAARLNGMGAPADTRVHVSPVMLPIVDEFRAHIADGEVLDVSRYRSGDVLYPTEPVPASLRTDAVQFVREVLGRVSSRPDGFVLDVARLESGEWAVLESNPVWSSNPYDAVPAVVIRALAAATMRPPGQWAWTPDPWLVALAARKQPLPLSRPLWV